MRKPMLAVAIALCTVTTAAVAQTSCPYTPCVAMQFDFTVVPDGGGPGNWPDNIWNGPGPMPTSLQETFFVDPASASGIWGAEPASNGGFVLGHVDESFAATNMTLTANGQVLQYLARGSFGFAGDRANDYGPAGSFFGGLDIPNGGGGSDFNSQYAQAPPDWAAFLSNSHYGTDTGLFTISGSFGTLDVFWNGGAVAPSVSVPEPGSLALSALAGLVLLAMHRRRLDPHRES